MIIILYVLVAFIVFFICYKKYYPLAEAKVEQAKKNGSYYRTSDVSETVDFWFMVLIPAFWIVAVPMIIMWKILEKVYNKFN